ncbi:bifunctional diaminohydroxyphosphoribosylaminopyrimidine deaminase/5-amino-6-(5-phosphoribosylamino)uracil reductase RibD [bacterium]|nr:bifunctional diaminohydroxyphosphoribosylaminopyrimidine deaminase/5-amino-6-(5-phosphoribosylamino)uracil reductase RibD [bacterium]
MTEEAFWQRAIELARKALLTCAPNPMVGAVIVKGGKIIGEGYHQVAGCDHAEIRAIKDAKKKGHDLKGAVIYVTLEPCSTYGRTPPCTKAIIENQFAAVKIGTIDPNPKHAGRAVKILTDAGIKVTVADRADCRELNEVFNARMEKGRPFIHLKWAMSLDGKLAAESGDAKWISNEKSRYEAHKLRAKYNAVLVGSKTVIADDPSLGIRLSKKERQPFKIVLDSEAKLSYNGRLTKNTPSEKIIIAVSQKAKADRIKKLKERGFTVIKTKGERVSLPELLKALAKLGISGILVEGGSETLTSFLKAKLADRITVFIAPKLLGGTRSPITQSLCQTPKKSPKIVWTTIKKFDDDFMLEGEL